MTPTLRIPISKLMLVAAVVSALPILTMHALPVLEGADAIRHLGHGNIIYAHVAAGVISLAAGAAALAFSGTGSATGWHRAAGFVYVGSGAANALAGLSLSVSAAHGPPGLYVATATVALTWLVVTAMACRALWNGRFRQHRNWMIRSYVLTWTFVGCRIAQGITIFPSLGPDGPTAAVWLNWVVPLLATEVVLQWRATGSDRRR